MKVWITLLKLVLIVSIPVLLILLNLHFLANAYFIQLNYSLLNYDARQDDLITAKSIIEYVRGISDKSQLDKNRLSEREVAHLTDVRALTIRMLQVQVVASFLSVLAASILIIENVSLREIKKAVYAGLLLTLLLVTAIGSSILLDFNNFFINFHQTFFTGNSWVFSPSDTLILLFPFDFWVNAAGIMLILTSLEVILALSIVYKLESVKERFNKLMRQLIIR